MSLLDLINAAQAQPQSMAPSPLAAVMAKYMGGTIPVGAGSPSTLPTDPTQAAIDQQIATLSQPAPTTDIPAPNATKKWQKIVGGLADAVSAYGHGLNANAPLTHIVSQLLNTDEARKAIMAQNEQRRAAAADAAKKYGAALKLEQLKGQQTETAAERRFKANEAFQEKLAQEAQASRERIANADAAARAKAEQAQRDFQQQQQARAEQFQLKLAGVRQEGAGDKEQHNEYAKARQAVVALKNQAQQMIAQGKDPTAIRQVWQDTLDASDLTGDYKAGAQAFFEDKVGSILFPYEYQPQGPAQTAPGVLPGTPQIVSDLVQGKIQPADIFKPSVGQQLLQRGP